jgi:hypothetical protein
MTNMSREAIGSDEYAVRLAGAYDKPMTKTQKRAALASVLQEPDHISKLGQAMIGPIQIKLRYEGITRNILLEDPLVKGAELVYDVLDDLGKSYFLNDHDGEVKVTPFEGKRVNYTVGRIASYPAVRKDDLYALKVNTIEYAQDETKQAIMKQEDDRLLLLLTAAIASYKNSANHAVTPSHDIQETSSILTPGSLYAAISTVEMHELESQRLIMNPQDARDLYLWKTEDTGWKMKDEVVMGAKITSFGEFQIQRSVRQTAGTTILAPDPQFLGMLPVMYSLDVVENNKPEEFLVGWVMDEVLGFVILNPRGLARIVKS